MREYLIPGEFGEDEFIEKRSRFIGRVWRVTQESEALQHIKETRERHWDASHNVYAYAIHTGNIMRYTDDGEPSGTAGVPVLNVFRSSGIQDFCCVVTRYFGGILLGAGGLVRAYSRGAAMALDAAGRGEMRKLLTVTVLCTYAQYEKLRGELTRFDASVDDTQFGADVELQLALSPENTEKFARRVTELSAGTALCETTGETMRPVMLDGTGTGTC